MSWLADVKTAFTSGASRFFSVYILHLYRVIKRKSGIYLQENQSPLHVCSRRGYLIGTAPERVLHVSLLDRGLLEVATNLSTRALKSALGNAPQYLV